MKRNTPIVSLRIARKWLEIVFLALLPFLAVSGMLLLLPLASRARRAVRVRTTSFFAGITLVLCGVRVRADHRERLHAAPTGRLVIANHVSYVDILVVAALMPSVFITSVELRNTPLLGMLAKLGGSLFVERRRPGGLKQEIGEITGVLKQGFTVVLFPEGTTSNGEQVQPFKQSLFDAAVSAGADILPLCLRYSRINDAPVSQPAKDCLFYYGGVSFTQHFPRFLSLRSVEADVMPLKLIRANPDATRKELASATYDAISKAYCS